MDAQMRAFASPVDAVPVGLPADTVILAIFAPAICNSDEIHEPLIRLQPVEHSGKFGVLVANHYGLRVLEHPFNVFHHETRNMWNAIKDEIAVGSHKTCHLHVLIEDA